MEIIFRKLFKTKLQRMIAIYDSGEWKDWTDEDIVKFQLYQV
jgi:hypothetical protein